LTGKLPTKTLLFASIGDEMVLAACLYKAGESFALLNSFVASDGKIHFNI
jgi:hypothetical protein